MPGQSQLVNKPNIFGYVAQTENGQSLNGEDQQQSGGAITSEAFSKNKSKLS